MCRTGPSADIDAECRRYDQRIRQLGGIDIQLLGIGENGHIGFNEPDEVFVPATHPVTLNESTVKANARFFTGADQVPKKAVTMGMAAIMQAKKILLVANGEKKRAVLKQAFWGPVTPKIPASLLQLHHDVTVIYTPGQDGDAG